jgi:hypothetical protein
MTTSNPQTTPVVTKVSPIAGEIVEFDGEDTHIRYSADNWEWCIGESKESVYARDDLEDAYQKFKREKP